MASVNEKKVRELRERMARLDEANLDLSAENEDLKQQLDFATAILEDTHIYTLSYNVVDGLVVFNNDNNPLHNVLKLILKGDNLSFESAENIEGHGVVYKNVELKRI